jgi:hypothetical protein
MRRPGLLAIGGIQRDDRSFDADEDQVRVFHIILILLVILISDRVLGQRD